MTHPVRHQPLASLIGWSLVAGLVLSLAQPRVGQSAGASLSLSPRSVTIEVGETTTVQVLVASTGQAINAAEATVSFPKELLEAKTVSKSGSVFTLWAVDPAISNASGTASFSGGLPSPGYTGGAKRVISITFRAKKAGMATLTIGAAQVLANDGQGTNILSGTGSAAITIREPAPAAEPTLAAPTIVSDTHPDQNRWYPAREAAARWTAGTGGRGYNAVFDQTATTAPPEVDEGATALFRRTNLGDGVWYLHVRAHYPDGWSPARHFAFRVDGTAPEDFSLTVETTTAGRASVTFATQDATSGVAEYQLRLDGGSFASATSPHVLEGLTVGDHQVTVKAIDAAGNAREASATFTVTPTAAVPSTDAVRLTAILETPPDRLAGGSRTLPIVTIGSSLVLRGFAKASDRIRIVVRSVESVFEFPVAEIVDANPIEPAPPGLTAWKVDIRPDLSPGEHEIRVSTVGADGTVTADAPVIRFRVVTDVARIGNTLVPYRLILKLLVILAVLLAGSTVTFLVLFVRQRRHRRRASSRR